MQAKITLDVNGSTRSVTTDPKRSLLDVLREDFGLTGAKYGCGKGQCGACTVLMDSRAVRSCITPVASAKGKKIVTIEGLATDDELHPVQQAFLDEGTIQCGYCTPGMVLRTVSLLQSNPNPSDEEIVAGMDGNICRCNGYVKIINAVRRAASK